MVIGITGRIATGKSTLALLFENKGFLRIDADEIYHKLRLSSLKLNEEIEKRFGTLDNKQIMDSVKSDTEALSDLNGITHKFVVAEIDQIIAKNSGADIVLDVPVPVKKGFLDTAEFIIVTECSEKEQIRRIISRDRASEENATAKISIQSDFDFYRSLGDYVINTEHMNAADLEILVDKVISAK